MTSKQRGDLVAYIHELRSMGAHEAADFLSSLLAPERQLTTDHRIRGC